MPWHHSTFMTIKKMACSLCLPRRPNTRKSHGGKLGREAVSKRGVLTSRVLDLLVRRSLRDAVPSRAESRRDELRPFPIQKELPIAPAPKLPRCPATPSPLPISHPHSYSSPAMVRFVDLDVEFPTGNLHSYPYRPPADIRAEQAFGELTLNGDLAQAHAPATERLFTQILQCYPLLATVVRHLDLNDLHNLAASCRPFRKILLPQKRNLVDLALRCGQYDEKTVVRTCVRDLVRECMVCQKSICRNCTYKRKLAGMSGRKRQLCNGCKSDPEVISSEPCEYCPILLSLHLSDCSRRLPRQLLDVLLLRYSNRPNNLPLPKPLDRPSTPLHHPPPRSLPISIRPIRARDNTQISLSLCTSICFC